MKGGRLYFISGSGFSPTSQSRQYGPLQYSALWPRPVHLVDRSRGRAGDPVSECFPRNLAHPNTAVLADRKTRATENSRMAQQSACFSTRTWLGLSTYITPGVVVHSCSPNSWSEEPLGLAGHSLDRTVNSRFTRDPDSKYKLDRD